ncbi:serine hydrolase domain-containing protein [Microbacterium sp. GXS0129]|uniref:serine hydrolase domain-containing protein n=1 Tax=Microbacterium sp. GXS0129 TaxID=3377836 RepID=UPI00383A9DC0
MPATAHLESALDDFLAGVSADHLELHGLLIVRGDTVLAEAAAAPRALTDRRLLYSVSKTVTMLALATAIDDGLLGLDDVAADVLGIAHADPAAARLTVRHLARMSSGHSSESLGPMEELAVREGVPLVDAWFRLPLDTEPGSIFSYDSGATYVLGALVRHVTGESLAERARTRVLGPIGIGEFAWFRAAGDDEGFSGLHLTIEDMARIGMLLRDEGMASGTRIVSAALVAELTRSQIDNHDPAAPDWSAGYGLQLWRSRHGFRADGAYGQFVLVLAEHDTVIALTGEQTDGLSQDLLERVWRHLLPALDAPIDHTVRREIDLPLPAQAQLPRDGATHLGTGSTYEPRASAATDGAWEGFGPSRVALTALRVEGGEGDLRFGLVFPDGESATLAGGRGHWIAGALPGLGGGNLPVDPSDRRGTVAVTARAVLTDTCVICDVVLPSTPHRFRIVADPEAGTFDARWRAEPLYGPDPRTLVTDAVRHAAGEASDPLPRLPREAAPS